MLKINDNEEKVCNSLGFTEEVFDKVLQILVDAFEQNESKDQAIKEILASGKLEKAGLKLDSDNAYFFFGYLTAAAISKRRMLKPQIAIAIPIDHLPGIPDLSKKREVN